MATIRGPRIVRAGLVLALDTADKKSYSGSGSAWRDLSGNNNHATLRTFWGSATPTFVSSNGGYFNVYNPAWYDTVYGEIPVSASLKPTLLTMEAWVYMGTTITPANEAVLTLQKGTDGYYSYALRFVDGRLGGEIITSTSVYAFPDGSNPVIAVNTWHQILSTYDGTTLRTYVDGIERATTTTSGNITYDASNAHALIGMGYVGPGYNAGPQRWWGNARPDRGISIVRMYNRALSAAEVLQNFNANRKRFNL